METTLATVVRWVERNMRTGGSSGRKGKCSRLRQVYGMATLAGIGSITLASERAVFGWKCSGDVCSDRW